MTKRPLGAVFILLALYFALQVILRVSLPHALELDEAEQIFFAQWQQLGYGPQPPLYNWLQTAMFAAIGPSALGLALLKNAILFSCYVFLGLAATIALKDARLQAISVLGLLTLPQVSFMAQQDLTHTVALLAASAMLIYALFLTIRSGSVAAYALAGLATGFGFLAKYNFILLPLAALLSMGMDRHFRERVFDRRILVAVAVACIVVLPHGSWLINNFQSAAAGTLDKMSTNAASGPLGAILTGLASLSVAIAAFSALTLVVFVAVLGKNTATVLRAQTPTTKMIERMLLIILVGLIAIIVATGSTKVRERWLDPFLLILPLYLCMKIEAAGLAERVARKRLFPIAAVILVIVPAILAIRVIAAPVIGRYTKINVPVDTFATKLLDEAPHEPGLVVASDRHLAGNLRLTMHGLPVLAAGMPSFDLPFVWSPDRPILLAWRKPESPVGIPDEITAWLRDRPQMSNAIIVPGETALPYHFGRRGDTYGFGYAWVYPSRD